MGHKGVKMNWDDLQSEKNYGSFFAYRQSKLANVLFTIELADRLKGTNVTVCSLHPGAVKTEIVRTNESSPLSSRLLASIVRPIFSLFGKSSAQGALTSIYCATHEDVPKNPGAYYE
jgi:NAD(P)-dependent dehydrogenase (short-subunit alcohol dehydrogenase family)